MNNMTHSILSTQDTQFRLGEDGRIYFQPDVTNPVQGEAIACLRKGTAPLEPGIDLLDNSAPGEAAPETIERRLRAWLMQHIATTLEVLVSLKKDEADLPEPVREIAKQVYEGLGIVPRQSLEEAISRLDTDMRHLLRRKNIRLGPVFVFQPELNKPAAVRLRALLWSLYHGKELPAPVPADGIVSQAINPQSADKDFYRVIGYPVYGPRAVRIDMLDRVITAVYDSAQGGKFRARHEMAEWLGCPIEDLYGVLIALGHRKGPDPADKEKTTDKDQNAGQKTGEPEDDGQEKPELATFYLKKGKAFESPQKKKPGGQPKKTTRRKKKEKSGQKRQKPRVISTGPDRKKEDSPFAVLEQLKEQKK